MKYYLTVNVNGKRGYWKDTRREVQTLKIKEAAQWTEKEKQNLEEGGYCQSLCCNQKFIPVPVKLKTYIPQKRRIKL